MLTEIIMYASAWFLLSVIVAFVLGAIVSIFREAPAPGMARSLDMVWDRVGAERGEAGTRARANRGVSEVLAR
jgi:hypothetical protein